MYGNPSQGNKICKQKAEAIPTIKQNKTKNRKDKKKEKQKGSNPSK